MYSFEIKRYKDKLNLLSGKSDQRIVDLFLAYISGSGMSVYSMSNIGNNEWQKL
jgi:hypothetical protein